MTHEQLKIESLTKQVVQLKEAQNISVTLLKACSSQVGMILGESILEHIAYVTGGHFSSREYHYEKPVGEQ